jgi:prolyl oligopeptidase
VKAIKFGKDAALYLRALKNAPHGKILRLPLAGTDLSKAAIAVPEGRDVIEGLEPSAHGLYVSPLDGGPSHLRFHPRAGGKPVEVPILPVSSVSGLHCWNEDDLLFSNTSFLVPAA